MGLGGSKTPSKNRLVTKTRTSTTKSTNQSEALNRVPRELRRIESYVHAQRQPLAPGLREQVCKLYGMKCFACKRDADPWECGHMLSVKHGGRSELDNLRVLCKECNRSMGCMHIVEFIILRDLPGKDNIEPGLYKIYQQAVMRSKVVDWERVPLVWRYRARKALHPKRAPVALRLALLDVL